ncbi:hypothetical protein ANANG_G00247150 [Anguilla anguilla]|uniref:Uncharacterized protein n=1 Tax=Anguilla anguilla TaxID=7936 RepID=A0A9D3LZT2_ANGAN|nr:hypothetical protein ANANG_G00247150 [Anguilla anguilla]
MDLQLKDLSVFPDGSEAGEDSSHIYSILPLPYSLTTEYPQTDTNPCTYSHTHIHILTHTHTHTHTHTYANIHTHTHTHTNPFIYPTTHRSHLPTHRPTSQIHIITNMHRTNTHTHTHTHTHTQRHIFLRDNKELERNHHTASRLL